MERRVRHAALISALVLLISACSHTTMPRKPEAKAPAVSFYRSASSSTVYMLKGDRTYCILPPMQSGGPRLVHVVNDSVADFTRGYRAEVPISCGPWQSAQHYSSAVFRVRGSTICPERDKRGGYIEVDPRFTGACSALRDKAHARNHK